MKGEFDIILNGVIKRYTDFDDIPLVFDNLIRFEPEIIPEPHTEEQHEEMETYNDKLKELMSRELK
jgi:hypothetical protein